MGSIKEGRKPLKNIENVPVATKFLGELMGGFKIIVDLEKKLPVGKMVARSNHKPFDYYSWARQFGRVKYRYTYFISPKGPIRTRYHKARIPVLHK